MTINKKLAQMMANKPIKADVSQQENKLYLYGTIGDSWDGVTLDDVKRTVRTMDKSNVTIYINSYGGDATEGVAIRNFLMNTFEKIDVVVEGIAASSASIIATCGESLTMPVGTTYMIHNPWTFVIGNRKDILREANTLESLEQSYRNIYMERFTGDEEELIQLMDEESWLTADEAQAFGFATRKESTDEVVEDKQEQNSLVASLLNKYAARADSNNEKNPVDDDSENDEATLDETVDTKEQSNKFLSNFAKTFSQLS